MHCIFVLVDGKSHLKAHLNKRQVNYNMIADSFSEECMHNKIFSEY